MWGIRPFSNASLVLLFFLFATGVGYSASTSFQGRVTDAASGFGIEGARILLDILPADGIYEFETQSDAFGFFYFPNTSCDGFLLTATHRAYANQSLTVDLTLPDAPPASLVLTPVFPVFFDIRVQLSCITTGIPLQDVPVAVMRFDSPGASAPLETFTLSSDADGVGTFRGMVPGYYRFRANDPLDGAVLPKWESYSTAAPAHQASDKVFLSQAHFASAQLKPILQNLSLEIRGFDPVSGAMASPLKGVFVEITGLKLGPLPELNSAILPTQTAVTNQEGLVTFPGLPAVPYQVAVKAPGYTMTAPGLILEPNAAGNFVPGNDPMNPVEVSVDLLFNQLYLYLHSPYQEQNPLILFGLDVHLQGLKDTATEGIHRIGNVGLNFDQRFFANLIPGKYRVFAEGKATNPYFPVLPYFSGEVYVDLAENQWTDAHLTLAVAPAIIRGRLFAADASGQVSGDPTQGGPPIYQPRHQLGIQFMEKEADPLLPPGSRTVVVDTDETGAFTLELLPSLYGIQIESLTQYFGSHVRLTSQNAPIPSEAERLQGWPFYQTWPESFTLDVPPENGTGEFGLPLIFRSKQEYQLDLFVRRQVNSIAGLVTRDPGDPTPGDLGWEPTGMAVLTPAGKGTPVQVPLMAASLGDARFLLRDIPPGDYSLSLVHPRNSFTYNGSSEPHTVTLSAWEAPGVLPLTDPFLRMEEEPFKTLTVPATQACYTPSTTTLTFRYWEWDGAEYQPRSGPDAFTFKKAAYSGEVLYGAGIPVGPFTFWVGVTACGSPIPYFQGEVTAEGSSPTFDIYCGGPLDTNLPDLPANPVIQQFRVISSSDPTFFVEGTTVNLSGQPAVTVTTQDQSFGLPALTTVTGADNPNWVFVSAFYELVDPFTNLYRATVRMQRGTRVQGTVTRADELRKSQGIEGALVQVKNRFGNLLGETETDETGAYGFAVVLPAEPLFIEILAPGYILYRQRFSQDQPGVVTPDPGQPADQALMTVDVELEPIPLPTVTAVEFNRAGLFLSGTRAFGDANGMSATSETDARLTLTFSVTGLAPGISYALPSFDLPSGQAGMVETLDLTDAIQEAWLVDPRAFPPQPSGMGMLPGNPYGDAPVALTPPDENDYQSVRNFLDQLGGPSAPNVVFSRASEIQTQVGTQTYSVEGTLPLWKLPPGPFHPILILVTQRGAAKVYPITYSGTLAGRELKGTALPQWLAFVGEVLHVISRTPAAVQDAVVVRIMPEGRFQLTPSFITSVEEDPEFPGFLNYQYRLGVSVLEGMETPASGILGFAPGTLGLQMNAEAAFTVMGKEQRLAFDVSGNAASTEEIDLSSYLPTKLFGLQVENPTVLPGIELSTSLSTILNPENPLESQLTHRVSGTALTRLELNLTRVTEKIPSLGPLLKALDATKKLQFFAHLSGAIKLTSQTSWNTLRPRQLETGSTIFDHRLRRHVFGGNENVVAPVGMENQFLLDFNLGVGLNAKALNGRGKAQATLRLQGEEVSFPGVEDPVPVVQTQFNPDADWPFLTRIRGALATQLEASFDLSLVELSTSWEWELFQFEHEFGTAETRKRTTGVNPSFQWVPLNFSQSQAGPAPVLFSGDEPRVLESFLPTGAFDLAAYPSPSLLYTDWDVSQNLMTLKGSFREPDTSWSAPVLIAQAPAISCVALAGLADQRLLAVWSQVEAASLQDPFANHQLYFSLSDGTGTTWTAPQLLASLSGQAHHLTLCINAQEAHLVFLESATSLTGNVSAIVGLKFDGMDWEAPQLLAAAQELSGFSAAGGGRNVLEPTQLLFVETDGTVQSLSWDGSTVLPGGALVSGGSGPVTTVSTPDGDIFAAAFRPGMGLSIFQFQPGLGWAGLSTTPIATEPTQLALSLLDDINEPALIASWLTAGARNGVHGVELSLVGTLLQAEFAIAKASSGLFSDLRSISGADRNALVGAQSKADDRRLELFAYETLGFRVTPLAGLTVSETGTQDGFEVQLRQVPTHPVMVPLSTDAPEEVAIEPATLEFTPENGTQPLRVSLTGLSDGRLDGTQSVRILTGDPTSMDPFFDGFTAEEIPDVLVSVIDDGLLTLPQSFLDLIATWPVSPVTTLVQALNDLH